MAKATEAAAAEEELERRMAPIMKLAEKAAARDGNPAGRWWRTYAKYATLGARPSWGEAAKCSAAGQR